MQKLVEFLERQPQGYKSRLAMAISRRPSYLSRQLSGDRAFTESDCIGIEKFTGGEVRCEDILPHVDWAFVRRSPPPVASTVPADSVLGKFFSSLQPADAAAFGREISGLPAKGRRGEDLVAELYLVAARWGAKFTLDELLAEHRAGRWQVFAERAAWTWLPEALRLAPGSREVNDRQFVKSRTRELESSALAPDPLDTGAAA